MKTRRFVGPSSRVVLHQVRQALGADAVILSNRACAEGVEILAASHAIVAGSADSSEDLESQPSLEQARAEATLPNTASAVARSYFPFAVPSVSPESLASQAGPGRHDPSRTAGEIPGAIQNEIQEIKGLLRHQMATLAWSESLRRRPLRATLLAELLAAGFTAGIARTVVDKLPDDYSEVQARAWIESALDRNLHCTSEDEVVAHGGVYALVGPTGVGKTTTAAKLAARCVTQHGVQHLGLITTDNYRIGAHDQLRAYGKILGVPVLMAQDGIELQHALDALAGKRLVLIDTIGMGQRDRRIAGQHELLAARGVKRLLLLNATAQAETLDDVVQAYRGENGLAGAILTKVDEATRYGCGLDALLRHKLRLHYVASGQRVPEDLHRPKGRTLVQRAMAAQAGAGSRLQVEELGLVFGIGAIGSIGAGSARQAAHA